MNRIILMPSEVDASGCVRLGDRRARHIVRVLRSEPGQCVRVGLLNGPTGTGRVTETGENIVALQCAWDRPPPPPRIDVVLALPRPKVMGRLWPALASLGVGRIVLVNAERVERCYFDTHWLRPEVYEPRLVEGLEQSGDTHLPRVSIRRRLKPFLEDELDRILPAQCRVAADPAAAMPLLEMELHGSEGVTLAVGPEGGWTPFERGLLAERGFAAARLGRRTLRSDAACIALIAMLSSKLEDG